MTIKTQISSHTVYGGQESGSSLAGWCWVSGSHEIQPRCQPGLPSSAGLAGRTCALLSERLCGTAADSSLSHGPSPQGCLSVFTTRQLASPENGSGEQKQKPRVFWLSLNVTVIAATSRWSQRSSLSCVGIDSTWAWLTQGETPGSCLEADQHPPLKHLVPFHCLQNKTPQPASLLPNTGAERGWTWPHSPIYFYLCLQKAPFLEGLSLLSKRPNLTHSSRSNLFHEFFPRGSHCPQSLHLALSIMR